MSNAPLIILGMHRSGTSLITHWLQCCGLNVGDRLLEGRTGNTEGHFEDLDFLEWHKAVFTENQLPRTGFIDHQDFSISLTQEEAFLQILQNKQSKLWGWKDPRSCLFLDFYEKHIPNANYLIIIRHYSEVTSSLINRDLKTKEKRFLSKKIPFQALRWKTYMKDRVIKNYDIEKKINCYSLVYAHYNQQLLRLLQSPSPTNKVMVIDFLSILKGNYNYIDKINKAFNIDLTHVNFTDLFKNDLMSKKNYFQPEYLPTQTLRDLQEIYGKIKEYL